LARFALATGRRARATARFFALTPEDVFAVTPDDLARRAPRRALCFALAIAFSCVVGMR
jgi:hypothetical protein